MTSNILEKNPTTRSKLFFNLSTDKLDIIMDAILLLESYRDMKPEGQEATCSQISEVITHMEKILPYEGARLKAKIRCPITQLETIKDTAILLGDYLSIVQRLPSDSDPIGPALFLKARAVRISDIKESLEALSAKIENEMAS